MRGFTHKAAALLLAQTAWAASTPASDALESVGSIETVPTAYVTLRAPLEEDGTHVLALRLDLQESDKPCGHANLQINGQSIAQNATGGGTGAFTVLDGSIITASWDISCQNDEQQMMRMTVHSVNGKAVAHTTFTTSFRQTAPAVIRDVWNVAKVKYVRIRTTETEHILDDEDVRAIESEAASKGLTDDYDLDAQISALNGLKSQARELRDLIYDKEDDIMDHLVYADEEDTTSLGQCKDLACAFKSLAHEMRHAHGQLCDNASGWRAFFGCAHGKVFVEDAVDALEDEDEDWTEVYIEDMDWETDTTFFEDDDVVYDDDFGSNSYISDHYRSSTRMPLIMLFAETALIVGSALFVITAAIRRCVAKRRQHQNVRFLLPLYEKRYTDFPAESSDTSSFSTIVVVEEKDEKQHTKPHHVLDTIDDDDEDDETSTTVSEELSQFREAASLVSDLVAVSTPRESFDDAPPAYESADGGYDAAVTNGSRYNDGKQ